MKGSIVAALIGSVAASQHHAHLGFHARRGDYAAETCEVVTYTTTVYVYPSDMPTAAANSTVFVYPSPVPQTSSSSSSCTEEYTPAPPPPPPPSSTEAVYTPPPPPPPPSSTEEVYTPPPPPPSSTPVYVPPPVYSEAPKPKPSKPASPPSYGGNGGRIVTHGNKWAMTYTPYTESGECKSAGDVYSDIAKIAAMQFTTIRTYSTDCGVFENVVPACEKNGLKIIFGIFLEAGGSGGKGPFSSYANEQLEEIKSKAPKDVIAMIIVGNEAIFNHYCTAEELASYIDYVRTELQGAGFPKDIAITTTEPVDIWQQYGAPLCDHIDVFTVQVHPFFTSKVSAGDAGKFAKEQLEMAAAVCPGAASKGKYISEIGWPSAGNSNGAAIPGYSEQKQAIQSILEEVGDEACLFSFQNDKWKNPGNFNVEQNFGCSEVL